MLYFKKKKINNSFFLLKTVDFVLDILRKLNFNKNILWMNHVHVYITTFKKYYNIYYIYVYLWVVGNYLFITYVCTM